MTWGSKIQTILLTTTTLVSGSFIAAHADTFVVSTAETTTNAGNTIDGDDSLTVDGTGSITVSSGKGIDGTGTNNSVTLEAGSSVSASDEAIKLDGDDATVDLQAGSSVTSTSSKAIDIKKSARATVTIAGSVTSDAKEGVKVDGEDSVVSFASTAVVTSVKKGVDIKGDGGSATFAAGSQVTSTADKGIDIKGDGKTINFEGSVVSSKEGVKIDGEDGTFTFAAGSTITNDSKKGIDVKNHGGSTIVIAGVVNSAGGGVKLSKPGKDGDAIDSTSNITFASTSSITSTGTDISSKDGDVGVQIDGHGESTILFEGAVASATTGVLIQSTDGDSSTVADITFASGSTVTSTGMISGKDGDAGISILGHGGTGSAITFGGTVTSNTAGVVIKQNDGDSTSETASTINFASTSSVIATGMGSGKDGDTGVEIKKFSGSDITFAGSVTSNGKGIKLDDGASSTIVFASTSSVVATGVGSKKDGDTGVEIKKHDGSTISFGGSITSAGKGVKLDDGDSTISFLAGSTVTSTNDTGVEIKKTDDSTITLAGTVTGGKTGVKLDDGDSNTVNMSGSISAGGSGFENATGLTLKKFGGNALTNTGSITANATGAAVSIGATAVKFESDGGSSTTTFTNDGGTISATHTETDTMMTTRGTAFDISSSSFDVDVVLKGLAGDGTVTGDIEFRDGDTISVIDGRTFFDGIINRGTDRDGDLSIDADGIFMLGNDPSTFGPSAVAVNSFSVDSMGTLGIGINADPAATNIIARTVTLDGDLLVTAAAGNYLDTQEYLDVITGVSTIAGAFASDTINTPLLDLMVVYDTDDTVDLTVDRNAFDSVAGLTFNQNAVAASIESTYGSATGDYLTLLGELFTLSSDEYKAALDSLGGAPIASIMQSAQHSFNLYQQAINNRLGSGGGTATRNDLSFSTKGQSSAGISADSIWVAMQYGGGSVESDGNSSGYSFKGTSFLLGLDALTNNGLQLGVTVGTYDAGRTRFDNGDVIENDFGYQVGIYGQYETDRFYVRGLMGHAGWDADATRTVTVGNVTGTNQSNFDVDVFNIHGELGLNLGAKVSSFDISPYVALDYSHSSISNLTETGVTGAALNLSGSNDKVDATLGVRFNGRYQNGAMTIEPMFGIGVKTNLSDDTSVNGSFLGGPIGTNFTTISPVRSETAILDLGVTLSQGKSVVRMGYSGELGSEVQQQSGYVKMNFKF